MSKTVRNKPCRAGHSGQIRIIAGQWRGRKLKVLTADGLRPTSDRARETLFSWLQPHIQGRRCLDLFAGTGALGFEALSRAAECAVLVEQSPAVVAQLLQNQQQFGAENLYIKRADTLQMLTRSPKQSLPPAFARAFDLARGFDLIFVDPPWQLQCQRAVIKALLLHQWLAKSALVYVESHTDEVLPFEPQHWKLLKQKTVGAASMHLLCRI